MTEHELAPLLKRVPPSSADVDAGDLMDLFLDYVKEKGVELYPAQEEAILALFEENNVILNTPTGSGKSLVAMACHFLSLCKGRRSYYTCPIKALVNEKFLSLCREFGADQVGMVTGDASVNSKAPIICCTAEILANIALSEGENAAVHDVIMDEFHYYSDRERGVAWQIPLLTMPQTRFLLMSATFGDTDFFERSLNDLNRRKTEVIKSTHRPVPLEFKYSETLLHDSIKELVRVGKAPIYLVNFTQRDAAEEAQNLMSMDFSSKEEKAAIAQELQGVKFSSPYGKDMQRLIRHGIGLHHAGLLPKYRLLVEKLAQKGLLKVISGTDTLGVGVNVPIRTVLFTKLCKFDGSKSVILSVRDFNQISGRAGRKGFDDSGTVVVQAPEHVVENLSMEQKAAGDKNKLKRIVKKKPPEKGYVHWDQATFNRLITSPSEPLVSRFQVSHGMLLNILSRPGDGCRAMRRLIQGSHETPNAKRELSKRAFQMFRSLYDRKIIEFDWVLTSRNKKVVINGDLQKDFSLNQTLALYLLDTIKLLDRESPDYALDVLTLCESILENPELILRKQLDRLKTIRMQEMKTDGMEYDERMAELEKIEYPKPNREFIYDTFNAFSAAHPWVGQENIRPKSIAREMYETFQSFEEYIRDYDQQRAEGLLLRYLMEVYKVLSQTVPEASRNEEIEQMIDYFGSMIRNIDQSLFDEWEKLRNPGRIATTGDEAEALPELPDITKDMKAFTVQIRNEVFRFVRALAADDFETALTLIEQPAEEKKWTLHTMKAAIDPFYNEHQRILTDRQARHPQYCRVSSQGNTAWSVEQILVDADDVNDWRLLFVIDRAKSRDAGRPILELQNISEVQ